MDAAVDWSRIARALCFYRALGYRYVEVPWVAPTDYLMVTCPTEERVVRTSIGDLVGSAEQSLMMLDHQGKLGSGRFVACTPCFRNEPLVDELHLRSFMKVELYINDNPGELTVREAVGHAMAFFRQAAGSLAGGLQQVITDEGIDIELDGIELGSYGLRQHEHVRWVYATGLAEPRFSTALARLETSRRAAVAAA